MADAKRGRPARKTPADLVVGWPDEASDDPVVEVARCVALNLRDAIGRRSVRAVAATAQVDYTTIYAIINGAVWPDLMTLARLEAGLNSDLWPAGVARAAAGRVAQ